MRFRARTSTGTARCHRLPEVELAHELELVRALAAKPVVATMALIVGPASAGAAVAAKPVAVTTALLVRPASADAAGAATPAAVTTALLVRPASTDAADAANPVVVTTALLMRPASADSADAAQPAVVMTALLVRAGVPVGVATAGRGGGAFDQQATDQRPLLLLCRRAGWR